MSLAIPLTDLEALSAAEAGLAAHLRGRDAAWASEPSALPAWTRAHVVGHLVGNALGLDNLARWAATGAETPMYPSPESRASEIERRSGLPWADLLAELEQSAAQLETSLSNLTEPVAARDLRLGSGSPARVCDLAAIRTREVEIHRVDLADAQFQPSDWRSRFRLRTLSELAPFFQQRREAPVSVLRATDTGSCWVVGDRGPDLVGREADLLAWLVGRPHDPITSTDGSTVPRAPAWV
jgi:maleylpyruvate isomerase